MLLAEITATSKRVRATRSRLQKIQLLSECLRQLKTQEIELGINYLIGALPQGRIGIGPAVIQDVLPTNAKQTPSLTLLDVHETFERIAGITGAGSTAERRKLLSGLFSLATREEQKFLAMLALGELRQGALEGVMVEAIAHAAQVDPSEVRRAAMLAGNIAKVASSALTKGRPGLKDYSLQILQPVKPMLAQTAETVPDALEKLDTAGFEYKLDGVRVQIHKADKDIKVFTRRLHDVTSSVPEIVEAIARLPVKRLIIDGETLALGKDGKPYSFQTTMRRFGRKTDVDHMRKTLPLSVMFFDCLYLDGEELIDRPAQERFANLEHVLPKSLIIPRLVTNEDKQAEQFFQEALNHGHEGVMAKALDALYEAGNRGSSWLKVKPAVTLDLVVLAAEWGYGRREGWLSNLHLGARDPNGGFVMLGKTFKGMTDQMLEWQTKKFSELAIGQDEYTVYVRPEVVVEVAFNEIQVSSQYPGGLSLRFARVKRYRPDKKPQDADTMDTVRNLFKKQTSQFEKE